MTNAGLKVTPGADDVGVIVSEVPAAVAPLSDSDCWLLSAPPTITVGNVGVEMVFSALTVMVLLNGVA